MNEPTNTTEPAAISVLEGLKEYMISHGWRTDQAEAGALAVKKLIEIRETLAPLGLDLFVPIDIAGVLSGVIPITNDLRLGRVAGPEGALTFLAPQGWDVKRDSIQVFYELQREASAKQEAELAMQVDTTAQIAATVTDGDFAVLEGKEAPLLSRYPVVKAWCQKLLDSPDLNPWECLFAAASTVNLKYDIREELDKKLEQDRWGTYYEKVLDHHPAMTDSPALKQFSQGSRVSLSAVMQSVSRAELIRFIDKWVAFGDQQ